MREAAKLGQPLVMVDGLGWVWDRWVSTNLTAGKRLFMADGAPRQIDFTLTLHSCGADRPA